MEALELTFGSRDWPKDRCRDRGNLGEHVEVSMDLIASVSLAVVVSLLVVVQVLVASTCPSKEFEVLVSLVQVSSCPKRMIK